MTLRSKKLLVFILILVIAILACSSIPTLGESNNGEDTTGQNINNSGDQGNDSGQSAISGQDLPAGPDLLNLEDSALFIKYTDINYFMNFFYSFKGKSSEGDEIFGSIQIEGKNTVNPERASDFEMRMEGMSIAEEGMGYIHFVDLPTRDYVYIPESGCISFGNNEFGSPYDSFLDSDGMFIGTVQRVEKDIIVNGVLTDRYELTDANIDNNNFDFGETFDLEDGSLWVARQGYMVKLEMSGVGKSIALSGYPELLGAIYYEFSFTPSNEPILILPPAECNTDDEGQPESSFPMTDDATNITNIGDVILSYNTAYNLDDLVNFYKDAMSAQGYSLDTEVVVGSIATMRFIRGGEAVGFLANSDGEGGFYVTIAKED